MKERTISHVKKESLVGCLVADYSSGKRVKCTPRHILNFHVSKGRELGFDLFFVERHAIDSTDNCRI
jgi:hypothetical protein